MSIVPICELKPFRNDMKIKVRICRLWRPKMFGRQNQFNGLQCVLVDELNDAIEASVLEADYEIVAPKIKFGCIYEITRLHSRSSKQTYKVVPHTVQLYFNGKTTFKQIPERPPHIPEHRFYLVDCSELLSRVDKVEILTGYWIAKLQDVMGHITSVQPLEDRMVNKERLETKCDVHLQNTRNEEVRVTLWGDCARTFDIEVVTQQPSPIVAVFTSLKVKRFLGNTMLSSTGCTLFFINPKIPEAANYKSISSHALKMIPTSAQLMTPDQLDAAEKLSVGQLNILDLNLYQNTPFLCRAAVARFDLSNGWWYKACLICFKQLKPKPQSDMLVCPTDDIQNPIAWFKVSLILEDANDETNAIIIGKSAEELFGITCEELVINKSFCDQKELPQQILRVKGQIKLFQLRLGKVKSDTSRNDLLIQTVFKDQAQIHPSNNNKDDEAISNLGKKHMVHEMLPCTPPLSLKKSLPSSPTESSSSSKKRQREPVKKSLFTSTPTKKI
ncbi:replication protein A 70 kDa DNA-binding subunit B-like isoform X1 [Malus domestica]|uniref:replication protein A 70 kDa DNA-binding subunit B-like isoform X1 n=1 Tax=Malus domestica TaxID=3750 RepID=UPI00397646F1